MRFDAKALDSGEAIHPDIAGYRIRATMENALAGRPENIPSSHGIGASAEFKHRVALMDLRGIEHLLVEASPLGARLSVMGSPARPVAVLDVHSFPVVWSAPQQLSVPLAR